MLAVHTTKKAKLIRSNLHRHEMALFSLSASTPTPLLAGHQTDPDDVAAELHLDTALKNQTPRQGHYTSCLLFAADALIDMGMPVFAQR